MNKLKYYAVINATLGGFLDPLWSEMMNSFFLAFYGVRRHLVTGRLSMQYLHTTFKAQSKDDKNEEF